MLHGTAQKNQKAKQRKESDNDMKKEVKRHQGEMYRNGISDTEGVIHALLWSLKKENKTRKQS